MSTYDRQKFAMASLSLAQSYLSTGGSVSRLEQLLTQAGRIREFDASVHATPTGVTVSVLGDPDNQNLSLSTRIRETSINLGKLTKAESILKRFSAGTLNESEVMRRIESLPKRHQLSAAWHYFALFLIGFALSFSRSLSIQCGLTGGSMTLALFYSIGKIKSRYRFATVFETFMACFLSAAISIFLFPITGFHPSHLFIGTFAIVAPGFILTSAMNELMLENYQTGLIRFSQAFLTLITMGFSYILARECLGEMGISIPAEIINSATPLYKILTSFLANGALIFGFCALLSVPKRALLSCLFVGTMGWLAFNSVSTGDHPFVASFLAALLISAAARWISRQTKMAVEVFLVPGLMVLVPGLMAFSYLQPLINSGSIGEAARAVLASLMIASALSFGILIGQLKVIRH